MLVTKMAKADKKVKAIIISSNKLHGEFPKYLRLGKYFPLYKIAPSFLMKRTALLCKSMLGAKGKIQKKVLTEIIKDTDQGLLKCAIQAKLNRTNDVNQGNHEHIHDTANKLLPCRLVKADFTITGGSHVLPLDKHEEISALLKKLITHP